MESSHITRLTDFDVHLFNEGKHYNLYDKLGSHLMNHDGVEGTYFAVWAPNAEKVTVIGDFNEWNREANPMLSRWNGSGIWELFIPHVGKGARYKYFIRSQNQGYEAEKGDPFAIHWEVPPLTASIVWDRDYQWNDGKWLEERKNYKGDDQPMSVYEVHIGSWKRKGEDGKEFMSYRDLAEELPGYLKWMGFTHVEFLPITEHPFYGSWGYQCTGYFAPTSRYGSPQDFKYLIDRLHEEGIGVILDWVPSHFPNDLHGLHYFDGTHLFEHADPRQGYHPDWSSYIFNYGRNEVRSFLLSSALYWLKEYHTDGLRVDAVASMLYLDYSRKEGEWIPNQFGGRENIEAINFLRDFNNAVDAEFPDVSTIAEESTAWPMVSRPTQIGGLGFEMKWMMGWMHDTLDYMSKDPIYRSHHQGEITFSLMYAFTENFMLPLSHDEVVHGKGPLIDKMPGDEWQKFANLRILYAYMYAHPGTKLLFMGGEFGQTREWKHDQSLDWHLNEFAPHGSLQWMVKKLNEFYRSEPAFHEFQFQHEGFEWIDINDWQNSVISFVRKGHQEQNNVYVVINFTPTVKENYRIGVPKKGFMKEVFNTDDLEFNGSGVLNSGSLETLPIPAHGRERSVNLKLPPLGAIFLKYEEN
ncbi:1,4-alpha-glucan branching protein GlgB [Catalinimonas niigatensis]|uniref:1,4-alpha-glucan branching protein GlgB n=1 Tax=Catalinimonas niigatensis TaxID=1397264 RepID=UPI00266653FB|nr:1,4-alpha-glucan branching protein GlgB [Catalinimonas niigatensis]WPP50884.1 1,4-alpha-glucan branching protein GlgB [Catalinimonas niigatensis]